MGKYVMTKTVCGQATKVKTLRKKLANMGKGQWQVLSAQDLQKGALSCMLWQLCAVTHTLARQVRDRTEEAFFSNQFTLSCELGKVLNISDHWVLSRKMGHLHHYLWGALKAISQKRKEWKSQQDAKGCCETVSQTWPHRWTQMAVATRTRPS